MFQNDCIHQIFSYVVEIIEIQDSIQTNYPEDAEKYNSYQTYYFKQYKP